jgi:hypothetical protein
VSSELGKAYHHGDISVDVPAQEKLIGLLVSKAAGVFLWVRLALHDILRGLAKHDTFNELLLRVSRLPADIERLYEDMLQRLGDDRELYRQEAALYFQIFLVTDQFPLSLIVIPAPSVLVYCAVSERKSILDLTPLPNSDVHLHELLRQCKRTDSRIRACCAGMLEVKEALHEEDIHEKEVQESTRKHTSDILQRVKLYSRRTVSISHRTVLDFLLEKPAGQEVLKCSPENDEAIFYSIMDALLMAYRSRILNKPTIYEVETLLGIISIMCRNVLAIDGRRVYELLQSVEHTFRIMYASPCKITDEKAHQPEYDLLKSSLRNAIDFMGLT